MAWITGSLVVLHGSASLDSSIGPCTQSPEKFGHVMAHMPMPAYFLFPFETMWTQARYGHLNPGDQAQDFVSTLDTKTPVQLASLWTSQPVVLVFGSYT